MTNDFNLNKRSSEPSENPYSQEVRNPPFRNIPPNIQKYISHLTTTKSGLEFFRWLKDECGYQVSVIDVNAKTGEPIVHRMIGNAVLLQLWLDVRKNIPRDRLILIEIPPETEE